MVQKIDGINRTYLELAKPMIDAIEIELVRVGEKVCLINDSYADERQLLLEEHGSKYGHAGMYLRYKLRKQKAFPFPCATLSWAKGSGKVNAPREVAKRKKKAPITTHVHHCGPDGNYLKKNLKAALKRHEKWEFELTWRYECEYARPLRAFLRSINDAYCGVAYIRKRPSFDFDTSLKNPD